MVVRAIKFYNKRVIESGNQTETWIFEELQSYDLNIRRNDSDGVFVPASEEHKQEQRRKYRKNLQHEVRRLINENYKPGRTSFMTLTFKEDIEDLKEANKKLSNFFKRLQYKVGNNKLKYIWCWEIQENGKRAKAGKKVIHYHVVLFDIGFIPHKDLTKLWGHGFVTINAIDGKLDNIGNVGRYITKYFAKTFEETNLYNTRYWNKSSNLEHAKRKRQLIAENDLSADMLELEENKSYYSDYIAKIGTKQYVVRYYIHNKGENHNEEIIRTDEIGTGQV